MGAIGEAAVSTEAPDRSHARTGLFLIFYALAIAGSVVACSPFLVLMLPARVTDVTGPADVHWLGLLLVAGAIAASVSGVGAWSGLVLAGAGRIEARLWLIALLTVAAVAPILYTRDAGTTESPALTTARTSAGAARRMWIARLLVQVGAGGPAGYLLFWLRSLDRDIAAADVTILFAIGLSAAAVIAMLLGRWIDRHGRPFSVLAVIALVAGAGLAAMAGAGDGTTAHLAYIVFTTAAATFLALHSGQTLRILPDPERYGRDIGLFNITNTAPSVVAPVLEILLTPSVGFAGLFFLSACLFLGAGIALAGLASAEWRADPRRADRPNAA